MASRIDYGPEWEARIQARLQRAFARACRGVEKVEDVQARLTRIVDHAARIGWLATPEWAVNSGSTGVGSVDIIMKVGRKRI